VSLLGLSACVSGAAVPPPAVPVVVPPEPVPVPALVPVSVPVLPEGVEVPEVPVSPLLVLSDDELESPLLLESLLLLESVLLLESLLLESLLLPLSGDDEPVPAGDGPDGTATSAGAPGTCGAAESSPPQPTANASRPAARIAARRRVGIALTPPPRRGGARTCAARTSGSR